MDSQKPSGRSLRGFASMDKSKQKEIASKGGRAAHEKGTAHEFNSEEASKAAKKGHERGTAHEFTPDEARVAGRKGGMARAANRSRSGGQEGLSESPPPNPDTMNTGMSSPNEGASMGQQIGQHNPA